MIISSLQGIKADTLTFHRLHRFIRLILVAPLKKSATIQGEKCHYSRRKVPLFNTNYNVNKMRVFTGMTWYRHRAGPAAGVRNSGRRWSPSLTLHHLNLCINERRKLTIHYLCSGKTIKDNNYGRQLYVSRIRSPNCWVLPNRVQR